MIKRKSYLRILAMVLVLALGFSCFSTPAMAAGGETGEKSEVSVAAVSSEKPEDEGAEADEEGQEEETGENETDEEVTVEETEEESFVSDEETTEAESEETTEAEVEEETTAGSEEAASEEGSAEDGEETETEAEETTNSETGEAAAEGGESSEAETLEETREAADAEDMEDAETEGDVLPVNDADSVDPVGAPDTLAAPTNLKAVANNSYGIDVSWDAVDGAVSYIIYKHNGKKWVQTGVSTVPAYSDDEEEMEVGTECKYTVVAVGSSGGTTIKSSYDTAGVTAFVCPPQPKVKAPVSQGKTKLKLEWDAVESAKYYFVYRQADDKTWAKCSKVLTDTSFIDDTVTFGKTYTYAVVSAAKVGDNTYWSFTGSNGKIQLNAKGLETVSGKTVEPKKIVVPKVTLVGAECTGYKAITVTWKELDDADGYVVYRKVKGKKYKKIGTIKDGETVTFTDKKAKFATKYYYTVRAYIAYDGKNVRSKTWNEKGVAAKSTLPAPSNLAAQGSGLKTVKITWDKVKGAQGYFVYRKADASAKKWKKIGETNKKTFTYTDSIEAGGSYIYTVRGWRKSGKKTVKGLYDEKGVKGAPAITKKMKDGLQLYYNEKGQLIKDTESIIGKRSSYAIEVDWDDNVVTVYAKGDNGSYNLPVKAFVCSTGEATPIGTFSTPVKYRWHALNGGVYGQWCTRIHNGILFHSVMYDTTNANTLHTSAYNKLGTKCSHGCVRLPCYAAKWIYDNCSLGTRVTIKKSCVNPFGKPSGIKISGSHTWDPTDPNMSYKCRNNGCH